MLPLITLATNQITITDDEAPSTLISECSEQSRPLVFNKIQYEQPSESFLSILDDKNRIITNLKKQLQNQKMQLSYYIKRELDRSKIEELSESCTPQASEESLPLNLAINKFCKQSGIKTKLSLLHERMNHLDYKISNLLRDQEFLLRKLVNKLCEFVRCQESSRYFDFKAQFGSFITDPLHVELFDKLLGATLCLRRKLSSFKICCDRVLLVEEERNFIEDKISVEEVYSTPVEERINCNYLLGIQMEKAQLENEIRRISRHEAASRHRIKELNVIEKILHNLQWELNSSFLKNEESCISKMVKKINSEARVLLQMTKEQKRRFECEFSKTKCPDPNRILLYIRMASEGDNVDKKELERCGIKTDDEIRFFEMVKGEIDSIKSKLRQEAEKENRKLNDECEKLKGKITQVLLENSRTKVSNSALKQELEELKIERKNGLKRLKQERDVYKSQVEDLQAIREAYAQLVNKQPNTMQMEREFLEQIDGRDRKIIDLEQRLSAQHQELEKLKVQLVDQNDQIVVLNRFINLTRPNSPRETKTSNVTTLNNDPCHSRNIYHETPDNLSTSKENFTSSENKNKAQDFKTNKFENTSPRYRQHGASSKKGFKGFTKQHGVPSTSKKKQVSSRSNKNKNSRYHIPETLSRSEEKESLTCFKIYSQANGKTSADVLKAVVTASEEVTERGKMRKASLLSMEISYTNTGLLEYDEYELFKDCSKESILLKNHYGKIPR